MTKEIIDNPEDLESVVIQATAEKSIAVDTEFVWERTYYPKLGTIQIGFGKSSAYLIDVLAIQDLTALGGLLADPSVTKILHDAQQDLVILSRTTGSYPKNVFDTRCASGFAGLSSTISLSGLLIELLDVHLPKSETRADWLRRPLPNRQLEYALDDVRYLPAVYELLLKRSRESALDTWMFQEMEQYDDPTLYQPNDPRLQYSRVKGSGKLRPEELAILCEVADWRERKARDKDRPKTWIVPDKTLMAVSRAKPQTTTELGSLNILSDGLLRKYGNDIVEAVHLGLKTKSDKASAPHNSRFGSGAYHQSATNLLSTIADASHRLGLDPALVTSRREIETLIRDGRKMAPADHRLLRGWRRDFLDKYVPDFQSIVGGN